VAASLPRLALRPSRPSELGASVALVRLDLSHQRVGLPAGLLNQRDAAALRDQHEQQGRPRRPMMAEEEEHGPQASTRKKRSWGRSIERDLEVDERGSTGVIHGAMFKSTADSA